MYVRRQCYDKPHRCPGWNGGGMRYPRDADQPRRWWQQRTRCEGGYLWARSLSDPWRNWRWHRCTRCDVLALPYVTRYFDPAWWRSEIRSWRWGLIDDVRWHRNQWTADSDVPWWSPLRALWKGLRSKWFSARYRVTAWCGDVWRWYAPRHRQAKRADIAHVQENYGVPVTGRL